MKKHNDGSEIHRLKPMQVGYDEKLFNRLYKTCKPVIRNLVRQIDSRRFNVTPDIIASYFWDKMLYVFNKYYGTVPEEHLKANILRSLTTYKNKLLRSAYGEAAEYNQNLSYLEDLFDDSKGLEDDTESEEAKEDMRNLLWEYMQKHLSSDAFLVFEAITLPPEYIKVNTKEGSRITNITLARFFNMSESKTSLRYISELRDDIQYWQEKAQKDLTY